MHAIVESDAWRAHGASIASIYDLELDAASVFAALVRLVKIGGPTLELLLPTLGRHPAIMSP
jgi:hypothetical protein